MTPLTLHSTGLDVLELQDRLRLAGFNVEADGWFGPATESAVRSFQAQAGLVVDGIAGSKTIAALNQQDTSKLLSEADLIAAAQSLGIPVAVIKTVNQVESRGNGFDRQGRPVLLFERHVMYRQLSEHGFDADRFAVKFPMLVNLKRGGYAGGAVEWHHFQSAVQIDPTCAIESASWGLFQIMGYHWKALGYESAADFLAWMQESEAAQLSAFVRFIKANPDLHKALKKRDWPAFAAGYNGPAYRDNDYDNKLAGAFAKISERSKLDAKDAPAEVAA